MWDGKEKRCSLAMETDATNNHSSSVLGNFLNGPKYGWL
jgi:hypothetical protein